MSLNKFLEKAYAENEKECKKEILKLIEYSPRAVILDCGCWTGEFTLKLSENLGTKKINGIEIDKNAAKKARERGIKVFCMNLNKKFPLKSNSVDIVVASQLIEHLHNTDFFIKEIYRVLKRGGHVIISTNNLAAWHNVFSLLFGRQPFTNDVSNNYTLVGTFLNYSGGSEFWSHLRIFTFKALEQMLSLYGFKIEKSKGVGYYPFVGKIAKFLARINKTHSVYMIIKARK